jgi:hypothetical protein
MKNILTLSALAGLSVVAGVAQASSLVFDDYDTGAGSVSGTGYAFQNGAMLGGDRLMRSAVESNAFGLEFEVDAITGRLSVSSQPGVNGYAQLGYGYQDLGSTFGFQDLNFDASAYNAFEILVLSNDEPTNITISVRSTQQNPSTLITVTKSLPGGNVNTPTLLTYNFADFTGFNFNDIDQVYVEIDPSTSGDVTIDYFKAVPEPATMSLLAVAAAGFAARRRRK